MGQANGFTSISDTYRRQWLFHAVLGTLGIGILAIRCGESHETPAEFIVFEGGRALFLADADDANERFIIEGSDPTCSPSGKQIAFARNNGIWTTNVDGSGLTQLTHSREREPAWSPDGTRISLAGKASGCSPNEARTRIYVMASDGSNVTELGVHIEAPPDFDTSPA